MLKLVCNNCQEPIYNTQVYYRIERVSNNNDYYINSDPIDLCSKCARDLKVSDTDIIN